MNETRKASCTCPCTCPHDSAQMRRLSLQRVHRVRSEGQRLLLAVPDSLNEAAAKLGVGRSTVSDWRRGLKTPCSDAQGRLAAAYGIAPGTWSVSAGGAEGAPK